jgi:2'-5' RNA ligase
MRQFLAVDLSDELRAGLGGLQRRLQAEARGWRWVRPENIHLTLRFLGEVPAELDADCREAWRTVAAHASPFSFRLRGISSFPPRGRPRVLWVGVREQGSAGRLAQLAAAFEQAARDVGFDHENRPFRPHLTLARAERSGRATPPENQEYGSGTALDVDHTTLFRSELLPGGARYSVLESFAFGAS